MRHVDFTPASLSADARARWDALLQRASDATTAMFERYDNGQPPDPGQGSAIWADIKRFLLDEVFHRKCAYCEGVTDAYAPQHAEHWRPKNAVTDPLHGARPRKVTGNEGAHPGYWWLALTWENLIPACNFCNSGRGKGTQFPIAGDYVFSPGLVQDLDALDAAERPFLLHPFRGEPPERHMQFLADGHVQARDGSELGRWTIKVLNLNREPLVDLRRNRIDMAKLSIAAAISDVFEGRKPRATVATYTARSALFSRAVADVLASQRSSLQQVLETDE